jgi:2-polyprenyl-3-methyl-5-hydroxy-6-metoxy-1,4-benzoquinol methylase
MSDNAQQHWNGYYDQNKDFVAALTPSITKFLSYLPDTTPKTALDIGCGTGQLTRELWHRGFKAIGIDVSSSAINIARTATITPNDTLDYMQMDIEQDNTDSLPFQPYGLITCKLVYAFIHDKPAFSSKVKQLLDPQGIFVMITPLAEQTPPERRSIAVTEDEIILLQKDFSQLARYDENGLCYFIGRRLISL